MARAAALDVAGLLAELAGEPGGTDPATTAMVDAAVGLLSTYGLRRWSMEDVARRAGLGRATVYRRFEGREELVRAALGREARRFFSAVTAAVDHVDGLEAKVLEGFMTALEMARTSPMEGVVSHDRDAAVALLTSPLLVGAATQALVELCRSLPPGAARQPDADRLASVAETLVRLGVTLLLTPGTPLATDPAALRSVVSSLLR